MVVFIFFDSCSHSFVNLVIFISWGLGVYLLVSFSYPSLSGTDHGHKGQGLDFGVRRPWGQIELLPPSRVTAGDLPISSLNWKSTPRVL